MTSLELLFDTKDIPGIDNLLTHPPEPALPGHKEHGAVKVGMVLPEILLLPVPPHLGLLVLGLDVKSEVSIQVK